VFKPFGEEDEDYGNSDSSLAFQGIHFSHMLKLNPLILSSCQAWW